MHLTSQWTQKVSHFPAGLQMSMIVKGLPDAGSLAELFTMPWEKITEHMSNEI